MITLFRPGNVVLVIDPNLMMTDRFRKPTAVKTVELAEFRRCECGAGDHKVSHERGCPCVGHINIDHLQWIGVLDDTGRAWRMPGNFVKAIE